jgi:hypothetical protein
MMRRRDLVLRAALAWCAVGAAAEPADAQWAFDPGGRLAPQFHSYTIGAPSSTKISELAIPIYAFVPITQSLSVDVGASYAAAHLEQTTSGKTLTSNISGLTDSQVRANYVLGTDFVVLTAGVNLPTGHAAVTQSQQPAAALMGSDFLALPISNMGTGFGATGGVAIARPLGDWNAGFAVSMRRSASYAPFDDAGFRDLRYQPGDEYRARAGVDRAVGTGRMTLGLTYSRFGNDDLAGSIYNTGDRYLTTFSLDNTVGSGHLVVTGWNLFRAAGTLADSVLLAHEDIVNGALAYGMTVGGRLLEPSIEARAWSQASAPSSVLGTIGLRTEIAAGSVSIVPSVAYSFGTLAAQDVNGAFTHASMTGFHLTLAARLR